MKSKASVLRNGNIQHYSRMFDLYFVTEKQEYSYNGTKCNRLIYYILGKGKHRKKDHALNKVSKAVFDKKLKETKQYEEWGRQKDLREKERAERMRLALDEHEKNKEGNDLVNN